MKKFDLNIQSILEDWTIADAIRELISNALDESLLTNTKDPKITYKNKKVVIRDYGRGLTYAHLTQNESKEKQQNANTIGKFGIGLKDSMAVLNRKKCEFLIKSKHNEFWVELSNKAEFDLETLHAIMDASKDKEFEGTEITIKNVKKTDLEKSKNMFLKFNNQKVIDTTDYGQVIQNINGQSYIYINGLKVAAESNFAFSYNITKLSKKTSESLNRERKNVGRAAYTDVVKKILLNTENNKVINILLNEIQSDEQCDELKWHDIRINFYKKLNALGKHVFITQRELTLHPSIVDEIKRLDKEPMIVSDSEYKKLILEKEDFDGNTINTFDFFSEMLNEYTYNIIPFNKLTKKEMKIFNAYKNIIKYLNWNEKDVKINVKIVDKIQNKMVSHEILGLCDGNKIYIARSQLKNEKEFLGTFVHEYIHYNYHFEDVSRDFECILTKYIGIFAAKVTKQ